MSVKGSGTQRPMDADWVEAAVYGGAILGGGGGGSLEEGLQMGRLALNVGRPRLADPDALPEEALIVTISAVGAPSLAEASRERPADVIQAVLLLQERLREEIAGFIPSEVGGLAVMHGALPSAVFGIPVLDAPCNGRAHPTGLMGAMGLENEPAYVSRQAAVGGDPPFRLYVEGDVQRAARAIRRAAELAGGLASVARNPVPLRYVREHAAVGALGLAARVGQAFLQSGSALDRVERAVHALHGRVIAQGRVEDVQLRAEGGFDLGEARVEGGIELSFCNEYMTLERDGRREATFPDLIVTFDAQTGRPLASAELAVGQEVVIAVAPKEHLKLGAGMRNPELFRPVEAMIGRELVRYAFPEYVPKEAE